MVVTAHRALRIRFPALRSIVVCFLEAVPLLVGVVGLLVFFLFVFGVTGTELFAGDFHRVCVADDGSGRAEGQESYPGEFGCGARRCSDGFTCERLADPGAAGAKASGFDNVGFALLTVFQVMTLSGWSFVMYRAMDASGGYAVAYFVVLVLFGAYFVVGARGVEGRRGVGQRIRRYIAERSAPLSPPLMAGPSAAD